MFKRVRTLFLVGLLVLAILVLLPVPTSGVTSTLIIRPNAAGTYTQWTAFPATTPNWGCVNETVQNLDTNYVYWTPAPSRQDSYNLQDHTTEIGNISNVRVIIYAKLAAAGDDEITIRLVIAGMTYNGVTSTLNTTYAQYTSDWPTNPATNSSWTWSDIDALQAGFACQKVGSKSPEHRVTQLYVEVTYTPLFLPPVASFTYSPEIPIVNETVTFNASESYDPDGGSIANYTWSFGDTNVTTVTDPVISHIYTAIGSYTVTLNVTDDEGETDSTTQIVGVAKRPVADFTFSPESPPVGETVIFNASLSTADGGVIVNYTWNFGDGNITTVTDPVITHVYDAPQNYTVTLNITDSEGLSDTTSKWILVRKGPIASFTISPAPYYKGDTLTFNASASTPDGGTIDSYFWDFGDDTNGTGMIANHTYTVAGNFTVTLNVTDSEGLWDTASQNITVSLRPPVANFTISPDLPYYVPIELTFNGSEPISYDLDGSIVSWNWTIQDETMAVIAKLTGPVVSYNFTAAGTYTINLTVTDNDDLTNSTSKPILTGKSPVANFTYSPDKPLVGGLVTFNASLSTPNGGSIVNYTWNFGDTTPEVTETDPIITHTYTTHGTYMVTLNVTDSEGLWDTTSAPVKVYAPPVANFTYSPSVPKAGENVTFDASLSDDPDGTIVNYEWNFGDGTPLDYGMIVNHTYATNGTFTVVLTVTDNDTLTNSTTLDVTIIDYPAANFTVSPSPPYYAPVTLTFNASLSTPNGGSIVNYTWNFGDGNITTVTDPIISHTYTTNGTYPVTLNVTDSEGLWNTTFKDVTVDRRDVAVISVWVEYPLGATEADGVYPGWVVNVTVTVRNNGTVAENFTVTAYYDTNVIGTPQAVTNLAPGGEETLKFVWDTSGVAYSVSPYTINVTASEVSYEADITNNSLTTTLLVKYPGDCNNSGFVDLDDYMILLASWFKGVGEEGYDPRADFNASGFVDLDDYMIFLAHWFTGP